MLDKEEFKEKYPETNAPQIHEESYLEEISDEDREMYSDAEILTGKHCKTGRHNKFNNFGKKTKGQKYNTLRSRLLTNFNKFLDGQLDQGEIDKLYLKIIEQANAGEFQQQKMLIDRLLGKQDQNINFGGEKIKFTFELGNEEEGEEK